MFVRRSFCSFDRAAWSSDEADPDSSAARVISVSRWRSLAAWSWAYPEVWRTAPSFLSDTSSLTTIVAVLVPCSWGCEEVDEEG